MNRLEPPVAGRRQDEITRDDAERIAILVAGSLAQQTGFDRSEPPIQLSEGAIAIASRRRLRSSGRLGSCKKTSDDGAQFLNIRGTREIERCDVLIGALAAVARQRRRVS